MTRLLLSIALALMSLMSGQVSAAPLDTVGAAAPLTIGETFTINSKLLGEQRRINVYRALGYDTPEDAPLPVLYMPDGGISEDFLHVAGLLQVLVGNGSMRPFMLVGIENTERRRDLTGPTSNASDRQIAPRVGGSATYRAFLRDELLPLIGMRYRVTRERAIVGESLAGLFVLETLALESHLFDTYIAFDPSLWWNNAQLVSQFDTRLASSEPLNAAVFMASSDEPQIAALSAQLSQKLMAKPAADVRLVYQPMPEEHHATIYHPAALKAFRVLFAPQDPHE